MHSPLLHGSKEGHNHRRALYAAGISELSALVQADFVILTSDSPRDEEPDEIIQDMVAGFPDYILEANAATPFPPGFLQDPGWVEPTEATFLLDECYEYVLWLVSVEPRYIMNLRSAWAVGFFMRPLEGPGSHIWSSWVSLQDKLSAQGAPKVVYMELVPLWPQLCAYCSFMQPVVCARPGAYIFEAATLSC